MKLKYTIAALAAGIGLLTACNEEFEPSYLDDIVVDCSYVSLDVEGGSAQIVLTTKNSWTVVNDDLDWLTISPMSGEAGVTTLTFSAEADDSGRSGTVSVVSGSSEQYINVIQGVPATTTATCAEVIENGIDGKTYQVTGTCTQISNTTYGNWYLNDGTGSLYIYGTVNDSGSYDWDSFDIEVGDVVTVSGPRTTYNGVVELVDVSVISVTKSLIQVSSVEPETIPSEGGDVVVTLTVKGDGYDMSIPEDAQEWLSVHSISGSADEPVITFRATANSGATRTADIEFSSTGTTQTSTITLTLEQSGEFPELDEEGTLEDPYSVASALAIFEAGAWSVYAEETAYFVGIVSEIYQVSPSYGNANYYISDDGTTNEQLYVYRGVYLDGEDFTSEDQLQVGMKVVICGSMDVYGTTYEIVDSYIVSIE